MSGTLYLVPVPIGNLGDITLRALEVLRSVSVVAAEDTRHFATLQRAHGLRARTVSLHEHNEASRIPELIARLRGGDDVAVVSDAGTPVLSDPGFRLVSAVIVEGLPITSLAGASAVTTALAASGLPPVPFRFCGFPPRTSAARRSFYRALASEAGTLVCFEAPHRLLESLRDAQAALGDRQACLARSMTKPHEQYQRGELSRLIGLLEGEETVRGECTLLIAGEAVESAVHEPADQAAAILLGEGVAPRTVVSVLTRLFGIQRRRAYELAHRKAADR
jgi:16S rRNA (cytidine1402-2'-O)-methyltransferase